MATGLAMISKWFDFIDFVDIQTIDSTLTIQLILTVV